MKLFSLFLIMILSVGLTPRVSHDDIVVNNGTHHYKGKPYTGDVFQKHSSILIETSFLNGKKHGLLKYIRTFEGQQYLYKTWSYRNGLLHGDFCLFNQKIEVRKKRTYYEGKLHGVSKEYFLNGKLKKLENFSHGEFDGYRYEYYETGILKSIHIYNKGAVMSSVTFTANGLPDEERQGNRDAVFSKYINDKKVITDDFRTGGKVESSPGNQDGFGDDGFGDE